MSKKKKKKKSEKVRASRNITFSGWMTFTTGMPHIHIAIEPITFFLDREKFYLVTKVSLLGYKQKDPSAKPQGRWVEKQKASVNNQEMYSASQRNAGKKAGN